MSTSQVSVTVADRVATIVLSRPERLNAWTPVMGEQFREAVTRAEADRSVRVVVVTGAGRGFCAGLDKQLLLGHAGRSADTGRPLGTFAYLTAIDKPVLAAVNGPVAGSGLALALCCDLRFASTTAVFSTSFARRGLTAEHGTSWLLPRTVGMANALDLLLSARLLDAAEALRIGLVNRVVEPARLLVETLDYARDLAAHCSPRSLRIIKRQVWAAPGQSLTEALADADREMVESLRSDDFREGVATLLERRPPAFTGR